MSDYITSTNKLKIAELDFDAIKSALKSYLKGQTEFADYDFDSSAINILLDVLAYNTHYNAFYVNMLASEMFLDSATLRSSIVSLAKHLGYIPSSKGGASVYVDVSGGTDGSEFSIPKGTKFSTKIGTRIYTFLAMESHASYFDDTTRTYKVDSVGIKEGVFNEVMYEFAGTPNEVFEIPSEDADLSTLVVSVAGEVYSKADDLTELTATSKVYFVQEGDQNKYQIYFGDNVIGKKPNVSDQIDIQYNISVLGPDGDGASVFVLADQIPNIGTSTITLSSGFTRSFGGSERETTFSIREQAPRQFGLQKRVVTKNDYKTRLENDYNLVDSVRVWGGEENIPPDYGSVFISVKPKSGYVMSTAEQERISQDILKKRNVVGIRTRFVDPDYIFVIPTITVSYDPRKTTRTADQIKSLVRVNVLNYSQQNLSKFDQYFRYSQLSRVIDDTEVSITNNNMIIDMKRRVRIVPGTASDYFIDFVNPLYRPHAGHRNVISSGLFTYKGNPRCRLVDKDGIIMVVKDTDVNDQPSSYRRVIGYDMDSNASIVNSSVGSVDYETGYVLLRSFFPSEITDGSAYLYITAKPRIQDVLAKRNTIITIESDDISLTCIDDTDRIVEDKVRGY